jgi:hypothetical protein
MIAYWLAQRNFYLEYRSGAPGKLFDRTTDPMLKSPISDQSEVQERIERRLKAYIQWLNNGLVENSLYR